MRNLQSKRNIIQNIQKGLRHKTKRPFPGIPEDAVLIEEPQESDLAILFAEQLAESKGQFIYCQDQAALVSNLNEFSETLGWEYIHCWDSNILDPLQAAGLKRLRMGKQLDLAHASLSYCEALIADSGSILFTSSQNDSHKLITQPPVQIVIAFCSQLLLNMEEAIEHLSLSYEGNLPAYVEFVNGPCKTRAWEMESIKGGMGPNDLYVFFVDDGAMIPQMIQKVETHNISG